MQDDEVDMKLFLVGMLILMAVGVAVKVMR